MSMSHIQSTGTTASSPLQPFAFPYGFPHRVRAAAPRPCVTFPTRRSQVAAQAEALAVLGVTVGAAGSALAGQAAVRAVLGRLAVW